MGNEKMLPTCVQCRWIQLTFRFRNGHGVAATHSPTRCSRILAVALPLVLGSKVKVGDSRRKGDMGSEVDNSSLGSVLAADAGIIMCCSDIGISCGRPFD